jgi:hypothetical protein
MTPMQGSARRRDVQANGWAAIVIDDLESIDPLTPRILEIRGRAEAIPAGAQTSGPDSVRGTSAWSR